MCGSLFASFAFGDAAYIVHSVIVERDGEERIRISTTVGAFAERNAAGAEFEAGGFIHRHYRLGLLVR